MVQFMKCFSVSETSLTHNKNVRLSDKCVQDCLPNCFGTRPCYSFVSQKKHLSCKIDFEPYGDTMCRYAVLNTYCKNARTRLSANRLMVAHSAQTHHVMAWCVGALCVLVRCELLMSWHGVLGRCELPSSDWLLTLSLRSCSPLHFTKFGNCSTTWSFRGIKIMKVHD